MSQATAKIRLDGSSEPPDTYGIIIPLPESIREYSRTANRSWCQCTVCHVISRQSQGRTYHTWREWIARQTLPRPSYPGRYSRDSIFDMTTIIWNGEWRWEGVVKWPPFESLGGEVIGWWERHMAAADWGNATRNTGFMLWPYSWCLSNLPSLTVAQ